MRTDLKSKGFSRRVSKASMICDPILPNMDPAEPIVREEQLVRNTNGYLPMLCSVQNWSNTNNNSNTLHAESDGNNTLPLDSSVFLTVVSSSCSRICLELCE